MSKENYQQIDTYFKELKNDTAKIGSLYNENFLNWRGPRNKNKQPYTDYVAEKLLAIENPFSNISTSNRESYYVDGHDGKIDKYTNREEEIFAKQLFSLPVQKLGRIIDYQVPLKETQNDSYGKIDLVSFDADTNIAYLIELKMSSKETILRAALEIETYYQLVNKKRFQKYIEKKANEFQYDNRYEQLNFDKTKINKAVVFANEDSYDVPYEIKERKKGSYPSLKKFLKEYNIKTYLLNKKYTTASFQGLF